MIRKITLILLSMITVFAFCGCQLAVEGQSGAENTDALCGMFITFESLHSEADYFDNADWGAMLSGNETALYQAENKPIYAVEKQDELGGADYIFEGIEGIRLIEVLVPADEDFDAYWTSCSDYEMLDIKTGRSGDGFSETNLKLEGTLYVYINPELYNEDGDCVLYCNPVYQASDGRVYTVPADCGFSVYTGSDSIFSDGVHPANFTTGQLLSNYISCNTKLKVNGREEKWTSKITVDFVGIFNINKFILKEMDAQDNVISVTEITKDRIPEEFMLKDNTAYAILEEHSTDVSGNAVVERGVVDMDMGSFEVRFPDEKGFARTHRVPLKNILAPASQA